VPLQEFGIILFNLLFPESEVERRPFSYISFSPYPPAMPLDNPLGNGKADTGIWKFLSVEPLEQFEELTRIDRTSNASGNLGDFGNNIWVFSAIQPSSFSLELVCARPWNTTDVCATSTSK
jgi:hypothetical protein